MNDLVLEYAEKIRPILPLAKRAYGSRTQDSPAHDASREYTELLVQFQEKGGSLPQLAKELNVAYPGLRRRVIMRNVDVSSVKPKTRATRQETEDAIEMILAYRLSDGFTADGYHDRLAEAYKNGVSLAKIAGALKLSSAAPLYYGVQSSLKRNA